MDGNSRYRGHVQACGAPVRGDMRAVVRALWLAAALLAAALPAAAQDEAAPRLAVLRPTPEAELALAAAVEAGGGAPAELAGLAEPRSALALAARVCGAGERGAAAVVGGGGAAARLAAAAAARAGTPLLLLEATPRAAYWEALVMYPHEDALALAVAALCRAKGWDRAVVLYEGAGGAGAAARLADATPLALLARHLPPAHDAAALRDLLLVLKHAKRERFVVWCEAACARRVLLAAQRAGLLAESHSYILSALDLHTQDLDRFSHGGANITALRLFDPEGAGVRVAMSAWRAVYSRLSDATDEAAAADTQAAPPSALLLAYEAARLAAAAHTHLRLPPLRTADCVRGLGAFHADTLLNYLRSEVWESEVTGGEVSWDVDGGRRALKLEIVELVRGGRLQHAGVWAPYAPLVWERTDAPQPAPPPDSMTNLTFNVLIALNRPYVMRRQSTLRLSGNDRYEGFCIELIEQLAEILHFNYTFIEQTDAVYGTYNPTTGKWSGMIGRLMDPSENVHFAITDLTITEERERAVDFTMPFMNLGIGILFRKAKLPTPELFAFLLPFSRGVWIGLGFAYLGTSLLLYVVGRLCHEEWQNPYPCVEDPQALQNQFTLANALWFNLGAVLLQGSEIAPVAYGTRAVASVWWLFALVITSSYTANLATLLAKKSTNELIHNVEELAHNDLGITYGAKKGGSTYIFFEQSKSGLYQEMFEHMRQRPTPVSNEQGVKWVANNETYAFLMESTTIEYEVERNCNVTKVGPPLDSRGYGIAMRKNSTYLQALNVALLKLQEAGELRRMKTSWWMEKNGGGACKVDDAPGSEALGFDNFCGLFLVLAVGCAFGLVFSCVELAAGTARRARALQQPFSRRFLHELRFVFRFKEEVKPLHGSLSSSSGSAEESLPAEAEAEAEAEERAESRARARRRRSSLHAASLRRARHTASTTPAPASRRASRRATRPELADRS